MATAARLSALVSLVLAIGIASSTPSGQGSGVVALIGWIAVALLAAGLLIGIEGSITAATVAFVFRIAVAATLPVGLTMPLWAQVLLLVLMVEFATASFTFRSRPADPVHVVGRALAVGIVAMGIAEGLAVLTGMTEASGILVRAIGVGAVAIAAGWVTLMWRRSGLS